MPPKSACAVLAGVLITKGAVLAGKRRGGKTAGSVLTLGLLGGRDLVVARGVGCVSGRSDAGSLRHRTEIPLGGTEHSLVGHIAEILIRGVLVVVKLTCAVAICSHAADLLVPGEFIVAIAGELRAKSPELSTAEPRSGAGCGAYLAAQGGGAVHAGSELSGSNGPVDHLSAQLLRHVADHADILVQAVADLLDRLQLLGGHHFILLNTLQLLGVIGLGTMQLAGKLADIVHLLPQILDLSLELKNLVQFLFPPGWIYVVPFANII